MRCDIEITRRDGLRLRGRLYAPDAPQGAPLAVFSHGLGGSLTQLEHHGPGFAAAGVACLFFDFRGGGLASLSEGRMEDMSLFTEREDLLEVLNALDALPVPDSVDKARLALIGESQGGLVSLLAANRASDRVRALALWYPAFVIPDDARKRCPDGVPRAHAVFGLPLGADYEAAALATDEAAEQRRWTKPVLLIHGDADDIVPIEYSVRAAERFPDARLICLPGAGHGFDWPDNERAREETARFILAATQG